MAEESRVEWFKSAAVLLKSPDRWILQHRDDKVGIAQPSTISMWGGRSSKDETPVDNARRELREETGLDLAADQLEEITNLRYSLGVLLVDGTVEMRHIEATLFLAQHDNDPTITLQEGQSVLYLPLPQLFARNPVGPQDMTIELDLIRGCLAGARHPVYEQALISDQQFAAG